MNSKIEEICIQVLHKVTPKPSEREHMSALAEDLKRQLLIEAQKSELEAEMMIGGSVAKDTWISGEADIDLFMIVSTSLNKQELGKVCLNVARQVCEGYTQRERYADHPYLEVYIGDVRVNIVPCYKVTLGKWVSAVDRTPFHTEYVNEKLTHRYELRDDIRLLKQFMRGINVYGAEIRVGGFSGYLCELLIINSQSFVKLLEEASKWVRGIIVDVSGHYNGRLGEVANLFKAPLSVIDPVDEKRNVAAAVTLRSFCEFITASRIFLKNPRIQFFYPSDIVPFKPSQLRNELKIRGTDFVFVIFTKLSTIPDIHWGQLYKSLRSLKVLLMQNDFNVIKASTWSDGVSLSVLSFELESKFIAASKRHVGPPIDTIDPDDFLKKHLFSKKTVSGPWIENGRWIVEVRRRYSDASLLLQDKLEDGGKSVGIARGLIKSFKKSLKILVNEEIESFYSSNFSFARFLTELLDGKPKWLS